MFSMIFAVADDTAKNPDFWTVTFPAMIMAGISAVVAVVIATITAIKVIVTKLRELKTLMQFNTDETLKGVNKINEIKSDTKDAKETAAAAATMANRANVKAEVASVKAETAVVKAEAAQGRNTEADTALLNKMDTVLTNVNGKLDKNVDLAHEAGVAKGQRDTLIEKANDHGERLLSLENRMGSVESGVQTIIGILRKDPVGADADGRIAETGKYTPS